MTKDIKETFCPAWLMPQGIVKLLEIRLLSSSNKKREMNQHSPSENVDSISRNGWSRI